MPHVSLRKLRARFRIRDPTLRRAALQHGLVHSLTQSTAHGYGKRERTANAQRAPIVTRAVLAESTSNPHTPAQTRWPKTCWTSSPGGAALSLPDGTAPRKSAEVVYRCIRPEPICACPGIAQPNCHTDSSPFAGTSAHSRSPARVGTC